RRDAVAHDVGERRGVRAAVLEPRHVDGGVDRLEQERPREGRAAQGAACERVDGAGQAGDRAAVGRVVALGAAAARTASSPRSTACRTTATSRSALVGKYE